MLSFFQSIIIDCMSVMYRMDCFPFKNLYLDLKIYQCSKICKMTNECISLAPIAESVGSVVYSSV